MKKLNIGHQRMISRLEKNLKHLRQNVYSICPNCHREYIARLSGNLNTRSMVPLYGQQNRSQII